MLLYALALLVNILSIKAVTHSGVLMGEEMTVSIRDVLFSIEERAQASIWSTNFGAPTYYWLASLVDPQYSLFSARYWKSAAMALIAPILYLVLLRRLDFRRSTSAFGALTATLLPGVAMFGWVATENGLEAVAGMVGLYAATSSRGWWRFAPVFGGLAVTTYTSGVAWAVVIGLVCVVRVVRGRSWRDGVLVGLAIGAAALVVLFPRFWWLAGPQRLVAGGGTVEGGPWENVLNLGEQLAVSGRSYYFFGDQPALGSTVLAAVALVCVAVAGACRWRAFAPWLAVAAVSVVLWIPAGNVPGLRRAIALSVVAAIAIAVTSDVAASAFRPIAGRTLIVVASVATLASLLVTHVQWASSYINGAQTLTADFPIAPGPMPPTFADFDRRLRSGELTVEQMVADHDGLRTLAVVWMLADRSGAGTTGLPTPREIVVATLPRDQVPPGWR